MCILDSVSLCVAVDADSVKAIIAFRSDISANNLYIFVSSEKHENFG